MRDNKKFNRKSSKPNSRRKGKRNTDVETEESAPSDVRQSGTNDPSWYAQTPELMRLAASIPFSNAAGVSFSLDMQAKGAGTYSDTRITIPGLICQEVIPCPHVEQYANDPINVAANAMLSFVVHANSRNLSYNAPDLMIYNIAMGNIYAYINFMMRVYGSSQLFSTFNRNLPRTICIAQGVDYDDLMAHLADFRYGVNLLINKAASFSAPADMPYFRRLAFMFSGIYSEGESIKDQLYMYVPAGFMQYDEVASTTGGSLKFSVWNPQVKHTVKEMLDYGNALLNAIITSEDMNVISGDILKAYTAEGLLKLATMPEAYTILPTTDLAVLEQMQNATWIGTPYASMNISITQKQSAKQGPVLTGGVELTVGAEMLQAATNSFILNTILTDPKPEDIMERTRMMCGVQDTEGSASTFYATELVRSVQIWTNVDGSPEVTRLAYCEIIGSSPTQPGVIEFINNHCLMETFKFHPRVNYFQQTGTGTYKFLNFAMDTDNYTVFNYDVLERMNSAAIMSLFNSTRINLVR